MSPFLKAFAIVAHRPEERSLDIIAVFCECEIVADALRYLRVYGKTPFLAALTHDLQRIEPGSYGSRRL